MNRIDKMKLENVEYDCNGIIFGFNKLTQRFYMEAGKEYFEFKERSQYYYDMLSRINYSYSK